MAKLLKWTLQFVVPVADGERRHYVKLDGAAVQYALTGEYGDVVEGRAPRNALFGYPALYDESADMDGHIVLVPGNEQPHAGARLDGALCVCMDEESAQAAREAGAAALHVSADVPFQTLYNFLLRTFVDSERLDAQLRACVDTYAGFQPLLDACAQSTGRPCALIDEHYRLVCQAQPDGDAEGWPAAPGVPSALGDAAGGPACGTPSPSAAAQAGLLADDLIDLFMATRWYRYLRNSRNVFTIPGSDDLLMKNVFSQGRLVGSLVMWHEGDATSARYVRFLLNYLSAYVGQMYGRMGTFGLAAADTNRVKAALEGVLAGAREGREALARALAESGHAPGSAYVVLRIDRSFTNDGAGEHGYLMRRFEVALPRSYCFSAHDALFMLVDVETARTQGEGRLQREEPETAFGNLAVREEDRSSPVLSTARDDLARQGEGRLQGELPVVARDNLAKVGMSRPFRDMRDFDAAMVQATTALRQGNATDPAIWCYRFDDYALGWLASRAVGDMPAEYVCHAAIPALARYDAEHGTQLLETLATFLRCRYNATAAAQALFVARSTLLNRLERIVELTGVDLDDFDERTYLALSFALLPR